MIFITRPVTETHKRIEKTDSKVLDNNLREKENLLVERKEEVKKEFSREDLEKAVEDANHIIFKDDKRFEFKMHERTGRMMVKLIDKETDEIIKEIPPEKILDLVASIWDLVGILVDERG
ncbi:flagellar protein FlaG [Tissierella creatinophila]|uniref:Flagellar protein FlaG n=1 Tax=Tissierella creatinophila DSM 6911 TaxID=1123403 RepID=A0A1U7M8Z3_TISCR|nr:flagellar protein FlaG [Tissierella creatinophila]OLS03782.1 flagellar protein FlaG [Tissierella creatinophila DSM 6911]